MIELSITDCVVLAVLAITFGWVAGSAVTRFCADGERHEVERFIERQQKKPDITDDKP